MHNFIEPLILKALQWLWLTKNDEWANVTGRVKSVLGISELTSSAIENKNKTQDSVVQKTI